MHNKHADRQSAVNWKRDVTTWPYCFITPGSVFNLPHFDEHLEESDIKALARSLVSRA